MIKSILSKAIDIINPPLIQFSPIRSGSTLIYNILRETFPEKRISKRHNISVRIIKSNNVIVTYRNPLDCLASSLKRYDLVANDTNIKNQIFELKRNGLDDLLEIFENKNILKLKYEDFYHDYDLVFDNLEIFFNNNISEDVRRRVAKKFDIDEVVKLTKKYKNFSQYNKQTYLHGNHISNSRGAPNSYVDFFNKGQLNLIQEELQDYILKFGYKKTIYNNK